MDVLTIVEKVVIPFVIVALLTWVNIKIKFAKAEAQAMREAKVIFFIVVSLIGALYLIRVLVSEFTPSTLPDRHSVFIIVFDSLTLFYMLLMWWMLLVVRKLEKLEKADKPIKDPRRDSATF